jgi:long-chain fatty acid transport protein
MKDIAIYLNAAYKLTDKLSVGIGARAEVATSKFSMVLGPADLEFGRGYAYGGGFQLGLHYQARDDLTFGLAYRSPSWFGDLSGGDAKVSLFGLLPVPLGSANIDELRLPQRIMAGAAWDATDWLKFIGEARWINYGNSTFHSTTVATDGLIDLRYPLPLGYRDQWAFILGAEFKLDERWTLGVGYHYATAPVPRENLLPMCSILSQHHATIGLRYETERWWVGGGYIVAFRESLRGRGYSDIPLGIDYGLSNMAQTQHSIFVGFGFRW